MNHYHYHYDVNAEQKRLRKTQRIGLLIVVILFFLQFPLMAIREHYQTVQQQRLEMKR